MSSIAKQTQKPKIVHSPAARWNHLENPGDEQFIKLFDLDYKINYFFYKFDGETPPHLKKADYTMRYDHGLFPSYHIQFNYDCGGETNEFAQELHKSKLFDSPVTRWNPVTGEETEEAPWVWFKQIVCFDQRYGEGNRVKYGLLRIKYDEDEDYPGCEQFDVHVFEEQYEMLDKAKQLGILKYNNKNNEDDNTQRRSHFQ